MPRPAYNAESAPEIALEAAAVFRALIFGKKLIGELDADSFHPAREVEIELFPYPTGSKLPDLTQYNLVVLSYSAFSVSLNDDSQSKRQAVFEHRMGEALKAGTNFCFLHYQEFVPRPDDFSPHTGRMQADDIELCRARQLGFRCLRSIAAVRRDFRDAPFRMTRVVPELEDFKPWGISYNAFIPYLGGRLHELGSDNTITVAFLVTAQRASILYVPFRTDLDTSRKADGLSILVNSLALILRLP